MQDAEHDFLAGDAPVTGPARFVVVVVLLAFLAFVHKAKIFIIVDLNCINDVDTLFLFYA